MSSEPAISVSNLGKCYPLYTQPHDRLKQFFWRGKRRYYREFWALRDINFDVMPGEALGIIGRNGSGKSTLLQLVCGTLTPTTGDVTVRGRVAALLELGAGFNPEFSGLENVYLQGTMMGFTPAEIEARLPAIEAFADIGGFIHQPMKHFSSGMFIRLAFACAVNVDPDILIVDEALAVGDVRFQLKCQRKFEEFREMKKTLLLVSHSSTDVVRLCQKTLWLDEGRIRRAGSAKHVVEEYLARMIHDTGIQPVATATMTESPTESQDYKLALLPQNAFITGDGGATINAVGLFTEDHQRLTVLDGPTNVQLIFNVTAKTFISTPFFGFQIINSKGLRVLGSNSYVLDMTPPPIAAGTNVSVCFSFLFPEIENGSYLIALGVADGTGEKHIRHQFIADAYEFQFLSTSPMQTQAVLLKLPNCSMDLSVIMEANNGSTKP